MAVKDIKFAAEGREAIMRGVDAMADAVKITLGPKGRNVMLEWAIGSPHITKDGVKVARFIDSIEGTFENMGAQLVYEVAKKTSKVAGDGTTTAVVLTQGLCREGYKLVAAGFNPMGLKRGVDKAVQAIVQELRMISKPIKDKNDIAHIASISANNDKEIGEMISDAMEKVGKHGVVLAEEGNGIDTKVEVVEGMHYNRGYISTYFVTDQKRMRTVLNNPFILIYDEKISTLNDLVAILKQIAKADGPLMIIADDVEGEALSILVANKMNGNLEVAATKPPGFGDRRNQNLGDIAALTGAQVVTKEVGIELKNVTLDHLGRCKKVIIDKDNTFIVGGAGSKADIEARIQEVKAQIKLSTWDYDQEQMKKRLAKLIGGVAVIYVGAATETEMKEKKARFENALNATHAAIEKGIVPGGGTAMIRCLKALDEFNLDVDEQYGVLTIKRVLEEPLRQIADNAGFEGSIIVQQVKDAHDGFGFNAETGEFGDLLDQGVIDPTKVIRLALQNAASLASTILATETVIADKYRKPPPENINPHMKMPGMQSHLAKMAQMGGPEVVEEKIREGEIDM